MGQARKDAKWWIEHLFSLFSLLVSVPTLFINLERRIGQVRPLDPSGYAVIRGIGSSPSDHLLMQMDWSNTTGKPVLIRHPYLLLRELDSEGNETDTEYRFELAGEYPEVTQAALSEIYGIKGSFALEPNSVSLKVLVFHTENWWNNDSPFFTLRLPTDRKFRVYIGYQKDLKQCPEELLTEIATWSIAGLVPRTEEGHWYKYWHLP